MSITQEFTPFPTPLPDRNNDTPEEFSNHVDAFLGHINTHVTEGNTWADQANTLADEVNTNRQLTEDAKEIAVVAAKYAGVWDAAVTYASNETVQYGGKYWVSLVDANLGNTPSDTSTYWDLLALYQNTYFYQEFTTSGIWTKPEGVNIIDVILAGAGGGGAAYKNDASVETVLCGSGGGGGALQIRVNLSIAGDVTVTIGAGGVGGTTAVDGTVDSGTDGGDTSITDGVITITATGGRGGQAAWGYGGDAERSLAYDAYADRHLPSFHGTPGGGSGVKGSSGVAYSLDLVRAESIQGFGLGGQQYYDSLVVAKPVTGGGGSYGDGGDAGRLSAAVGGNGDKGGGGGAGFATYGSTDTATGGNGGDGYCIIGWWERLT